MLKRSFSMLPGIGKKREESLWAEGIHNWNLFLDNENVHGISIARKRYLDALLKGADRQLHQVEFLSSFFPRSLHWRLYDHLREKAVYLDIETNGLSHFSDITLVGIYRMADKKMISLTRGFNLSTSTLKEALKDAGIIITFNGASFDLPFIRRRFPGVIPEIPHFDLRFGAGRIGIRGGLKAIEKRFGICRDFEVENLAGEDALIFWKMWKKDGNRKALQLLKKYNQEDVENLIPLANIIYGGLKERTLPAHHPSH